MEEVTLGQSIELRGRVWTVRHWRDYDGGQGHSAPTEKVYDDQRLHPWVCTAVYVLGERVKWGVGEGMYMQNDKTNLSLVPVLLKTCKEEVFFI